MRTLALAFTLIVFVFSPIQQAVAQSPEMPVPQVVVKDADGKVVARVNQWHAGAGYPFVILNIAGTPGLFKVSIRGLSDYQSIDANLFYSSPGCTGEVFMLPSGNPPGGVEAFTGVNFAVYGPDPSTGEYSMYRSPSTPAVTTNYWSEWKLCRCYDWGSEKSRSLVPVEEVVPNPLAGFHGPTEAQPDRYWTISGGDRLP